MPGKFSLIGPVVGVAVLALLAGLLVMDSRQRAELRRASPSEFGGGLDYGRYYPAPLPAEVSREQQEMLAAVGYNKGYEIAQGSSGVTIHDRERAQPGLNLVLSGHAPEASLIDLDGRVLHTWTKKLGDVWQEPRVPAKGPLTFGATVRAQRDIDPQLIKRLPKRFLGTPNFGHSYFRRAYLYPNGDLLTFFSFIGAIKLDSASNVIWSYQTMAHHDLDVGTDGRMYVLSTEPREFPGLGEGGKALADFVAVFGESGALERKIGVLDAILNSRYAGLATHASQQFDLLHTNSVVVLDGTLAVRIPAFRAGNLLVSCRNINTIAVIDVEQNTIVWAMNGPFVMQHDPAVLPNGNLLIFDNHGNGGYSRVTEYNPLTQEIAWEFAGTPPESFYAIGLGAASRLPNGNTLISESTRGRAFEVTPENEVVWEYINPHRDGDSGELIAVIFDTVRVPADYAEAWLDSAETD